MPLIRIWLLAVAVLLIAASGGWGHPLGNFTVSHYSGLTVGRDGLQLRYVLDHAEIPAFQERQTVDADRDGRVSAAEEAAYLETRAPALLRGLGLEIDGRPVALELTGRRLGWAPGAGGLPTLRVEVDGHVPAGRLGDGWHSARYRDDNLPTRAGWKEIVVRAGAGGALADSTAPATDQSQALAAYPADLLASPPQEVTVRFRFLVGGGTAAVGGVDARPSSLVSGRPSSTHFVGTRAPLPILGEEGLKAERGRGDALARLIQQESFPVAFLPVALLIAFGLGCLHALSPGHGKAMVGAYLIGSRATPWHAVLLGVTVTVSHTIGVFLLGLVVLYASRWIVPERLYPWLGFASGAAIFAIGLGLLTSRLKGLADHQHAPGLGHRHVSGVPAFRPGTREAGGYPRSGWSVQDGSPSITERPNARTPERLNLLLLGISGGIVPCPSALVVLLSAISLHRVGLGLLLIVAFSAGLASVLVAIGLLMVTCRRMMERLPWNGSLARRLPVVSAAVVCVLGAAVALQSLSSGGAAPRIVISAAAAVPLVLGFILGMKHALETDHLVAVSTIVAEGGGLLRSAVVGAFWGLGHTSSLFLAALLVIGLRIRIPERVALGLEFTVALMLIALGLQAIRAWGAHRASSNEFRVTSNAEITPVLPASVPDVASLKRMGRRPYLVGLVHGMAGSAALMLLVLTTIPSPWLALLYVLLFGFGSVVGMLGMSVLLSLPLRFTARRLGGMVGHVRLAAGLASAAFGLFMTWEIGFVEGLFR